MAAFEESTSGAQQSSSMRHAPKETRSTEGETRRQVMVHLLQNGPVTVASIGRELGLSAAGVRRHLDILVEEGLAETVKRRVASGHAGQSQRGRPAKYFRLTDSGRAQFGHSYDELASDALAAMREVGGSAAVKNFAKKRMERILAGVETDPDGEDDDSVQETVRKLVAALDAHGYAATVNTAGQGMQICQHHCPVARVAADHPELCEAEQEIFSTLLGTHVQPLASIADGHGICTTNVPLHSARTQTTETDVPHERSGS